MKVIGLPQIRFEHLRHLQDGVAKKFFLRLWQRSSEIDIWTGSAALAYYFMLSIFPGIIFLLSLLPFLATTSLPSELVHMLNDLLPVSAANLFNQSVMQLMADKKEKLLSFGAVFTLWAASSGISSLMSELNSIYQAPETRSYLKRKTIGLSLTVGFGFLILVSFLLIVLGESFQNWIIDHLSPQLAVLRALQVVRWAIVMAAILFAVAALYQLGPDIDRDFTILTPGSLIASVLFVVVSLLFKLYVDHFANYNATYGSLGAVIALMIWLNILGAVVLLGAHVNFLFEENTGVPS